MPTREEIREGLIKEVLPCRWAAIIEKQNPHGYELYPDMIEDLADFIIEHFLSKGWLHFNGASEVDKIFKEMVYRDGHTN